MDISDFINKNKNSVFSLIIIIISLVIAFNIYIGQMAAADSLKFRIGEEGKKNEVLSGINKLEDEVNSYRKILVKKDASLFMSDINNFARETGVKVTSIKPSGEEALPEYTKYTFALSITSPDYDNLAEFINKLETYESVYIVEGMNIDTDSFGQDKELKAELSVSALAILD